MIALLLLPLLITFQPSHQDPPGSDERSPVKVTSFRWFKDRQAAENVVEPPPGPQPAMIGANRNFERQRRINASAGDRDPNLDTLDGRSAALDKIVQESREAEPVDGFTYEARFQNTGTKLTQTIFWEYQFTEKVNAANTSRRRFVCAVKLKPEKDKVLQVFSTLGPNNVINVKNLARGLGRQFEESIVIDRIEYADGSVWQRKDWNFEEVKLTARARSDRTAACRSF
jgi:hypothetical protein